MLMYHSKTDALITGLPIPENPNIRDLVDYLSLAGDAIYMHGDPNLDNQKRNISIEVFLSFDLQDIVSFGKSWLKKWEKNKNQFWHREWVEIIERADYEEISEILLASHSESTRKRSSSPLGELLDFDVMLSIKRRTNHAKT